MEQPHKSIMNAFVEFVFLSMLALLVPLILAVDILVIGHDLRESSLTELTQEVLVFISAALFWVRVRRYPQARGFLALVAGLFSCMFIRELDGFFDDLVFPGFWVWPAIFVAVGTMIFAGNNRNTVLAPMADFIRTKSYIFILFGLIMLLVFSRCFGCGALWRGIMGDPYRALHKMALQEGLELLGYVFLSYGSFLFPGDYLGRSSLYGKILQTAE